MTERKPWGWHTRFRGHKQDEPLNVPNFLDAPGFDFPRNGEREYLAAIGIAAIVVMRDGERLEICASRDIEKTFRAMQGISPGALCIVGVWWVRNRRIAEAVAKAARNDPGPWLDALIERESRRHGSGAVAHASAMDRMRIAGSQIDAALRANGRGELAWFNRAYRAYRMARDGPAMSYQSARARLRRAVVRRLVVSGGLEFGCDLLPDVFG